MTTCSTRRCWRSQAQRQARRPDPAGLRDHGPGHHAAGRWPNHLGTEVVDAARTSISRRSCCAAIPAEHRPHVSVPAGGAVRRHAAGGLGRSARIPQRVDELGFVVSKDIQVVVADPAQIEQAIDKYYGEESDERYRHPQGTGRGRGDRQGSRPRRRRRTTTTIMADLANEAPIVRFVNLVLFQAVQDRASDIHFEPFEDEFKIRYRVDGALYEMSPPPKHLALPVISRIKVMANLNISERRLPQDGRISYQRGRPADRPARLHAAHPVRRVGRAARAGPLARSTWNSRSLGLPEVRLRLHDRGHPAAQRHLHRHRPDRLRQDHHALFLPAPGQHDRLQAAHRRGPGRIRHRRHHAGGRSTRPWA